MDEKGMSTEIHMTSGTTFKVSESLSTVEDLVNTTNTRAVSFQGPDSVVHWINVQYVEAFHAI